MLGQQHALPDAAEDWLCLLVPMQAPLATDDHEFPVITPRRSNPPSEEFFVDHDAAAGERRRSHVRDILINEFGSVAPWQRRGQSLWFVPVDLAALNVWVCLATRSCVVVARAPALRGLWIRMRPGQTPAFGADEIVGHRVFDDRFVVKTNDPAHARAWLCEKTCSAMADTRSCVFELNRKWARALVDQTRIRDIPTAVRAVAGLAEGAELGRRWENAAQALGARIGRQADTRHPHGPMQANINGFQVDLNTRVMTLGRREKRARLHTEVSTGRLNVGGAPFVVYDQANTRRRQRPDVRSLSRAPRPSTENAHRYRWYGSPGTRWSPPAQAAFQRSEPLALIGDRRRVTAYLPGFVDDPARLEATARLCLALAVDVERNTAGPYR